MRTIKFRGKDLATGKWLYGDLLHPITSCRIINYTEFEEKGTKHADYHYFDVDPDTIGEFTGLYDCNGKEIYEDDILRFSSTAHDIGYVRWDNELAQFVVVLIADRNRWYCIYNIVLEVVGNIHDNQELKKK